MDAGSRQTAPDVETRWAFVSTNRQTQLAAAVASYMSVTDKYVAFFEFPSLEYPYTGSTSFGTDGYVARALGDRVATSINNALARIQPEMVVFLGLTEVEKGYLNAHLPNEIVINVESALQVPNVLGIVPNFAGEVICRPNEVILGLLKARFERKRLVFDELAGSLPISRLAGNCGLFAIENDGNLQDIAAVNLAFSFGLDVALIPPVSRASLRSLPRDLHGWSGDSSHYAYQPWRRRVRTALRGLDLQGYDFVTFFTTGLPYGLFLGNPIPCSHVVKYLDLGVMISNAIEQEHAPCSFGSMLLFSPQLFGTEETTEIRMMVEGSGFRTKLLLGAEATVMNLGNFGAHYPYDILHICSHGGESDGYFTIQAFRDREGADHTIEYYEVIGFAPTEADRVLLHRKIIYHKLDGHRWMSPPLASFPKHVFEDMLKAIRSDKEEDVTRIPYRSPIALSCHIQCHTSIHQGNFDRLSGFGNPVVFNNTCASSHQLAVNLLYAGARCYIGTLWEVGNETAKQAAIFFYKSILLQRNLLVGFHQMLEVSNANKYRNVYVFWGFHFSTLAKPPKLDDIAVLRALMFTWQTGLKKALVTKDLEVKRNFLPVLRFLAEQIRFELERHGLKTLDDFDANAVQDLLSGLPPVQERNPLFELSEVDEETLLD
jgi:hypothetical protein